MLTVRLSKEPEARLENLAALSGHTKTFHAREAILEYFDDLESFYLAEKREFDVKVDLRNLIIRKNEILNG